MPEPALTPEEKLLRIIESPPEAARLMRPRPLAGDLGLSFKAWKAKLMPRLKGLCNLKSANSAIVVIAAAVTVFLGLDFWMGLPRLSAIQRLEGLAKSFDTGDLSIARLDPLSNYLREIVGRNIFALPEPVAKEGEAGAGAAAKAAVDMTALSDGLRLVGIIWSEAPQAIVEDTKDGRTHLLNRGGKIKNLRVKEILKDRVILSYDSQEIELR